MLVLTRKVGESIDLTLPGKKELIKVLIVQVKGKQVRVGIEAPSTITIDRSEVTQAKKEKDAFLTALNSAQKENLNIEKELKKED